MRKALNSFRHYTPRYTRRTAQMVFLVGLVACAVWFFISGGRRQADARAAFATITVNTASDNVANDGLCSLREAITAANTNMAFNGCPAGMVGLDTIVFNAGITTINVLSQLPTITQPVNLNGGAARVELNGAMAGQGVTGLVVTAGGSTIHSLVINRFQSTAAFSGGNGIELLSGGGNFVRNCRIGTDTTGAFDQGNEGAGILIRSSGNTIGGTSSADRNIISGNQGSGLQIDETAGGTMVLSNYIGTNAAGTGDLGNAGSGIQVRSPNTIIGDGAGARNVISGNDNWGIWIRFSTATGVQVLGNYIGTDLNGMADIGNSLDGILIDNGASSNTIGGTTAVGMRNIISGNNQGGVEISGSTSTNNSVLNNFIGTNATDTAALANTLDGVFISGAPNNTVGGTANGATNLIAFNTGNGINITGTPAPTGNRIQSNSIHSNNGLGIDLGGNGVTANDANDPDTGANNLQNFPVITSVTSTGTISGTFDSVSPNSTYPVTIQFFGNTTGIGCDPSGNGEGQTFINSISINAPVITPGVFLNAGTIVSLYGTITATATDNNGNTSEFSACRAVNTAPTITAITNTRSQGGPTTTSQIATVTDPNQALNTLTVQVNNAASATVNGVTVSGLSITAGGAVNASIATTCVATTATFTLKVTDNLNEMSTATLTVNVTANTAPVLGTYTGITVPVSGGATVTPSAAPSDNGTISSVVIDLPILGYTGGISVNPATGVVTITNAMPAGAFTVTVRATDSCGAVSTANFTLGVGAQTITVNTTTDENNTGAACSLREAITAANTNTAFGGCPAGVSGLDNIVFNLGTGTPTISPTSFLPTITDRVTIDGATNGATRVELNGAGAGIGARGLRIAGGDSTIRNLVVNRFANSGISLESTRNVVESCFIGTNAAGTSAPGGQGFGIEVFSSNNIIGGTSVATYNIISGNTVGISIAGSGNTVRGNLIGTQLGGAAALPNTTHGIVINSAANNIIGSTIVTERLSENYFGTISHIYSG